MNKNIHEKHKLGGAVGLEPTSPSMIAIYTTHPIYNAEKIC